ncbi:TetR-like C-terminal domain-containing protein [Streptomyces antibioticus]|uniref:TetR-like C-terminal domain-containing protein n=1 Tax=Streptomyces antibioticus TaxID=1890 RepID=UPI0033A86DDC
MVELAKARAAGFMLAIAHAAINDPEFAHSLEENVAAPYRAAMRKAIDNAIGRGELRPGARDLTYAADILPAIALSRRVFTSTDLTNVEEVVDTIVLPALRNA